MTRREQLVLVGASGLGREVLQAAQAQGRYDVVGFVDDDPSTHGRVIAGRIVLGGLDWVDRHRGVAPLVCVGKGVVRETLVNRLGLEPARYATVVHPHAAVAGTCAIAPGSVVLAGCVLTADVTVGPHVVVMPNVSLTHGDVIADYATLCAAVTLGGSVRVGRRAYLGMAASVRENVSIGAGAVVGMGSVVLSDVPAEECWVGVPARCASLPRAELAR